MYVLLLLTIEKGKHSNCPTKGKVGHFGISTYKVMLGRFYIKH